MLMRRDQIAVEVGAPWGLWAEAGRRQEESLVPRKFQVVKGEGAWGGRCRSGVCREFYHRPVRAVLGHNRGEGQEPAGHLCCRERRVRLSLREHGGSLPSTLKYLDGEDSGITTFQGSHEARKHSLGLAALRMHCIANRRAQNSA